MDTSSHEKLEKMGWELISKDKLGIYVLQGKIPSSQPSLSSLKLEEMDRAFEDFLKKDAPGDF